ncbi:MAG TPA: DNA-binding protein [Polyangiaceae bacterium]|nr:DNA-binding protein [Polyangiaceae bacterium]
MSSDSFENKIRKTIDAFVEQLSALVREAAVQSVTEAFGGGSGGGGTRGAARGPARSGRSRAKGQKRTPEELTALVGQLLAAVKAKPGLRMEQIAEGLKSSTQELALPAKKLIAEKKIKTKGERRATKYFPA